RTAAIGALSAVNLPDERLATILAEALAEPDEPVRLAAVNLLVGRPELLGRMAPLLEPLLAAGDEGVSRHAAYLLRAIGPESIPTLLRARADGLSAIEAIASGLSRLGGAAVAPLTQALADREPRVLRGASRALGQVRPLRPGTVDALTSGLDD